MIPTHYYLILSSILFGLGVVAFIFRRNIITIFMSIQLMLNAVNLAFVAFSQAWNRLDGQVFVLFVIVVAAAEAAVCSCAPGLQVGMPSSIAVPSS